MILFLKTWPKVEYLKEEDILLINKLTIKRHGGNFVPPSNLLKEESLKYLIEAVEGKIFGKELYAGIPKKAGFYMFSIINNHVFQDGNKRTGLESALLFLNLNGYQLKEKLKRIKFELKEIPKNGKTTNQILYHFTIELASGEVNLEECGLWFEANIEKVK